MCVHEEEGTLNYTFKSFLCGLGGLLFGKVQSYSGSLLYTVVNTTWLQRILLVGKDDS